MTSTSVPNPSLELSLDDLVRNKNSDRTLPCHVPLNLVLSQISGPFLYSDGRVSAILPISQQFITSPNASYILAPPIGSTRDLYRRTNGYYSVDDPVQHPQPFNNRWPFLPCIPMQPKFENERYYDHRCMWLNIHSDSLHYTELGLQRKEGVLKDTYIELFTAAIAMLDERILSFRKKHSDSTHQTWVNLLLRLREVIDLSWNRLCHVSSSLYDQTRGLAELQRAWLMAVAVTDYIDIFLPHIIGQQDPAQETALCIGAYV
jgi:hypothetical protein